MPGLADQLEAPTAVDRDSPNAFGAPEISKRTRTPETKDGDPLSPDSADRLCTAPAEAPILGSTSTGGRDSRQADARS